MEKILLIICIFLFFIAEIAKLFVEHQIKKMDEEAKKKEKQVFVVESRFKTARIKWNRKV